MTQSAQEGAAEAGSNQDAESVTARDDASDDDSDIEEGEIAGLQTDNIVRHSHVAGPDCSYPHTLQFVSFTSIIMADLQAESQNWLSAPFKTLVPNDPINIVIH